MRKNLLVLFLIADCYSALFYPAVATPATTEPAPAEVATEAPAEPEAPAEGAREVKKIAFFVSDLTNVFHQAQAAEAQKYGNGEVWR